MFDAVALDDRFASFPGHHRVAARAIELLSSDPRVEGLYLSGSFADGEPDLFSDIDLNVVVGPQAIDEVIRDHRAELFPRVADVATDFPATHLGDPHQVIVFYKGDPPIHVDYQYRTPSQMAARQPGRGPRILLDRTGDLTQWLEESRTENVDRVRTVARLQYLEDRFWGWCWYAYAKIERGEAWEARDAQEYIRTNVLVLLASISRAQSYEGNRRLERNLPLPLQDRLERTIPPSHSQESYRRALAESISLYEALFDEVPAALRGQVTLVDREFFRRSFESLDGLWTPST